MNWLAFLLKRKIIIGLAVVFILILGVFSVSKLDVEMMPTVDFDMAYVYALTGEMSPADIEQRVTNPIEQRIGSIEGIESYTSKTSSGMVSIELVFERGLGDEVFTELEAAMNAIKPELGDVETLETMRISTSFGFEMFMDIYDGDMKEMSTFATEVLKPRLEALPEIREVTFEGLVSDEITLELKRNKLVEYGLDVQQLIFLLHNQNQNVSIGEFSAEENQPKLRWDTRYSDINDLKNLSIPTQQGIIKLSDVAEVKVETSKATSVAWKNGTKNFIFTQIGRSSKGTEVSMTEAVRQEVKKIKDEGLVGDFKFEEMASRGDFVSSSIDNVRNNILIGAVLAFLIVFLFLRAIRATLIVGLAIPLSILLTFTTMWILGYSINMISLIALGLGIGMMVDASIVIIESIYSKRQQGLSGFDAVIQGTKEVAGAVVASMLTTIVVFLPIGLLSDSIGELMRNLSVVIVITLVSSVLVSFTLIPALAEKFLKVKEAKDKKENSIMSKYGSFVRWMAGKKRRRWATLFLFIFLFAGTIPILMFKVPMSVMPDVYDRQSELMVILEGGTTVEERESIVNKVNEKLASAQDVTGYTVIQFDTSMLYTFVTMLPEEEATLSQVEVNSRLLESLRELVDSTAIENIGPAATTGGITHPIQIKLKGHSFEKLQMIAEEMSGKLKDISGITDVDYSMDKTLKEKEFVLNYFEIEKAGMIPTQVKEQVEFAFMNQSIGEVDINGSRMPISLRVDQLISNEEDLKKYEIQTPQGVTALSKFAHLEEKEIPIEIGHDNGERVVRVTADYDKATRDLGSINRDVQQLLEDVTLPAGYTSSTGGSLAQQQEIMEEMILILVISIFLVYVVMAVQFNSLIHPLVVMSIIPMTIIGVTLGLFLTQSELNMMSAMGILMLFGIVVNNVILLIDRTRQLRSENMDRGEALIEAGKNRMRPIFMTTLSTVFGMLPLALATGNASNYQGPMAVVVISGLLFATLITLILIPAVYMIFEDILGLPNRIWIKLRNKSKNSSTETY